MKSKCVYCDELEQGDRLYRYGEDDVGITFERIENIQFCPVCGKKLLSFQEKLTLIKERMLDDDWWNEHVKEAKIDVIDDISKDVRDQVCGLE